MPTGRAADVLDFEEVDDLLDLLAVLDLLGERRPVPQHLPEQVALHVDRTAGHDVVERRHALEQRDVLEGAGDALTRPRDAASSLALLAVEADRPCCGV